MIEIETTIKGGLPVIVRADLDGTYSIHWANTGGEITAKVYNSIPSDDIDEINFMVASRIDTYEQDEADARGDWQYECRRERDW